VVFPLSGSSFEPSYSVSSIVLAFVCSTLIGFLPARSASKLDPIEVLAQDLVLLIGKRKPLAEWARGFVVIRRWNA
jgi:hypothetical protein